MKRHGWLNLILTLSFLFSNLGLTATNQTTSANPNIVGMLDGIFEGIDSWLNGMRVVSFETGKIEADESTSVNNLLLGIAPTAGPTQTMVPTASPTLPPAEVITPTVTPTPAPDPELLLASIDFNLEPNPASPGDVVTATWTINNFHGPWDGMEIWLYLPDAFIPLEFGDGTFNPDTNLLILPISQASGLFSWFIDGNAQPPYDFLVEVHFNGQVIISINRNLGRRGPDFIPIEGGWAHGFNHKVNANFPNGALPEAADVQVKAPADTSLSLGGRLMEFTATGRVSGMEITQFSQPVTITVQYTEVEAARQLENAGMKDESSLTLFYYDETMGTWRPLTTTVDPEANLLTATSDHFSLFDFKAQNWEAARLPSLESFQVAGFTGAGTYSYPIQVPAGPGGLQPSLAISHNSQTVDGASSRTQAAWVGMGWSLDTGYIQRNMNGTPNYFDDDTFSLQVNGVGGLLLPIADQDADGNTIDYQFADQRFWRVRQYLATGDVWGYPGERGYWVVWEPNGTQYYFGNYADGGVSGHAWYPAYPSGCAAPYMQTWRWSMTRVRNIFEKELTYYYNDESAIKKNKECNPPNSFDASMAVAVYPSTIIYPNNRYRVNFVLENNRTDYDTAWNDAQSYVLYMRSKLEQIQIWSDPNGIWNSGDEVLINKYELRYEENGQQIFPGVTWPAGGKTPTLTSITEYGLNGTNPLPTTTFTYYNMHINYAQNGYGGKVSYGYDNWHASNGFEYSLFTNDGGWNFNTGEYYPDDISPYGDDLDWLKQIFQPGVAYKIEVLVWPTAGNSWVKMGLDDGMSKVYDNTQHNLTWGQWNTKTSYVTISGAASQARALFYCNGGCKLSEYKVYPVVTRYRVTSRTLTDEVTNSSYVYNYAYEGAAVNDASHSMYVANYLDGYRLMTKPNSEFRGHSKVTETTPDGRVVESLYYQNDQLKGQAYQTMVKNTSGHIYLRSLSSFDSQEFQTYNPPHPEGQQSDFYADLEIWWTYPTSEENRTYNGDSTYVATRNEYQYLAGEQGGTQYGNRTRVITSSWIGNNWVAYRGSITVYFPRVTNGNGVPADARYLTGLQAYQNTYTCNVTCSWTVADLLGGYKWLYDNHASYTAQPDDGLLTGGRNLIYYLNPPRSDPYYADTQYTYDSWGNRTSVTQYTEATDINSFGMGSGPQSIYTCYGGGGTLNGYACSDDGYHTYPVWERNAMNMETVFIYDKTKGVPTAVRDPNFQTTNASYDEYGRILTIVRPGDDTTYPTARMSYHTESAPFPDKPFWTEAQQRITGSTYFTIRKYYNGLGQLLQTQVVGATISAQPLPRDILTDTFYDAAGRVYQQTVPYDVGTGSNYHTRSIDAARTTTYYDVLGRTTNSLATDSSPTTYFYSDAYENNVPYLYTQVTNPRGYSTTTKSDIWGRAVLVTPPTGPTVFYSYDAADSLMTVVRGGLTTTLTYDFGGRKTDMYDPDMGHWIYTYNALGNMLTQTDARGSGGCITTLSYDTINRITGKTFSGNCGVTTAAVTYYYDEGGAAANEVGRRTRMVDGSGSTTWEYDTRGRVTQETKEITNSGTFVTMWSYNSADLPMWMKYPLNNTSGVGEQVYYNYLSQMLLDTVIGNNMYVYNTDYDAAGRIDERGLGWTGFEYNLTQNYEYYLWTDTNGQGRTKQMTSRAANDPNSLQDLRYTYDANGNVMTIQDYVAGSPQTQNFTYDDLDRLTSAEALPSWDGPGGEGGGSTSLDGTYAKQDYAYDTNSGNISSMGGANYAYSNQYITVPPHGVQNIRGGSSFTGTITIRAKGTKYSNVWPTMKLYVNGVYRTQWTVNSSTFANYSLYNVSLTGNDQIEVVYTNDISTRQLEVDYVSVNGRIVQAEGGAALIDKGSGTAAFDWQNMIAGQQIMAENGALRFVVGERAFAGAYDENGNMNKRIVDGLAIILGYDAENRLVSVSGGATASFVYDGDGNRVQGTIGSITSAYIGNYTEWVTENQTSTLVTYYYAGATRVAINSGGTLRYLLSDHLGSTSITTDYNGVRIAEERYMPWGQSRYTYGTTPTTFKFTGQRLESSFGLYFYNARWYDPLLARFVSADTVVPGAGNSQAYDRYAYTLNNPVRYTDPSGHRTCSDQQAATGDETCDQNITDEDNLLLPPIPPPDELLEPGYEWWMVTEDGTLTNYYTSSINSSSAGLSSDPNDWTGDPFNEARLEGSVIIDGVLWMYDSGRFFQRSFCSNGGVPVGYGCLSKYAVTGITEDGRPIYGVGGAVAACPPGGGGTNACGTPGFIPVFRQGGPPLYVSVPRDSRNPGYVLIVNPIDSGGRLGETQIDLYTGLDRNWLYQLNNPYAIWRQVPSNFINPYGAQ